MIGSVAAPSPGFFHNDAVKQYDPGYASNGALLSVLQMLCLAFVFQKSKHVPGGTHCSGRSTSAITNRTGPERRRSVISEPARVATLSVTSTPSPCQNASIGMVATTLSEVSIEHFLTL